MTITISCKCDNCGRDLSKSSRLCLDLQGEDRVLAMIGPRHFCDLTCVWAWSAACSERERKREERQVRSRRGAA